MYGGPASNGPVVTPVVEEPVKAAVDTGTQSNLEENTKLAASNPGSLAWLFSLVGLYFIYYWFYNKKWKDAVGTAPVLSFLHLALSVTVLAVVGVNLINVFLTKLAALKIPIVSRVAGTFLPLFHL